MVLLMGLQAFLWEPSIISHPSMGGSFIISPPLRGGASGEGDSRRGFFFEMITGRTLLMNLSVRYEEAILLRLFGLLNGRDGQPVLRFGFCIL